MATVALWKLSPTANTAVRLETAGQTLDEVSRGLPNGAYTTFRTFPGNRVMHFSAHIARLEETARLVGKAVRLNAAALRETVHTALLAYPTAEKRARITLDLEQNTGDIFVSVEPLLVPSSRDYLHGVRVITRQAHRDNPKAKLTSFIQTAGSIREDIPAGINEVVMLDEDGWLLEGLTSNFFAVMDGAVWTAEEGVLSGLTRSIVLEEIAASGLKLQRKPAHIADLPDFEEAFLTSASRAVLPVVEIDGKLVGRGQPGAVTQILLKRYNARIERETEPV
ncbi:MAG TPA: aminotransferase class IV [Anaerolineaceae bacterium]